MGIGPRCGVQAFFRLNAEILIIPINSYGAKFGVINRRKLIISHRWVNMSFFSFRPKGTTVLRKVITTLMLSIHPMHIVQHEQSLVWIQSNVAPIDVTTSDGIPHLRRVFAFH